MDEPGSSNPRHSPESRAPSFDIRLLQSTDDEGEWSRVIVAYGRRLNNFFLRKGFGADEATELVQETFCEAFLSIDTFRIGHPFNAWLWTLARNTASDEYARARRMEFVNGDAALESIPAKSRADGAEARIDVDRARAKLRPADRNAFDLHVIEDMSHAAAAEVTGTTEEAMKVAFARAKKQMRVELQ